MNITKSGPCIKRSGAAPWRITATNRRRIDERYVEVYLIFYQLRRGNQR